MSKYSGSAVADWVTRHWPVCCILVVFLLSRAAARGLGVSFDYDNIDESWQLLDTHILKNGLAEGLLYLHSQPPLFNLLVGLFLKGFGLNFGAGMGALYSVTSLMGLLCFHALAKQFIQRRGYALALTLLICVAPETILYENKLYYEGLIAWWLVIGFFGLHRFVVSNRSWGGFLAFVIFALVVLTRSAFHPIWIFGLAALFVALIKSRSLTIMIAVCLPLLLVGTVMLKNVWIFGTTSLSSWGGINLAKMTVDSIPSNMRRGMIDTGILSELSAVEPFSSPTTYLRIVGAQTPAGVDAVDSITKTSGHTNFNHLVYVPVGKVMMHDAIAGLKAYPQGFLSRLAASAYHFNRPPSDFKGLQKNLALIAQYDRAFSLLVRGQPAAFFGTALDGGRPQSPVAQVGAWSVVWLALSMIGIGMGTVQSFRLLRGQGDPSTVWFISLAFTLAYAVAVVNVFDTWENNRARFMLEPLIVLSVLAMRARRGASTQKAPERPRHR